MDELMGNPLLRYGLTAVGVVVVATLLYRALFPARPLVPSSRVRCTACSWTGAVGKYNRKCSRCGSTALKDLK